MREGGGKEERVSSETGKVKAQWKDDLPHHIHTHLSSGQTLKERGRQEHFILENLATCLTASQYPDYIRA